MPWKWLAQAIGCDDNRLVYGLLKAAERAVKVERYNVSHVGLRHLYDYWSILLEI